MYQCKKSSAKILTGVDWYTNEYNREYVCFHLWDNANSVVIDFTQSRVVIEQGKGYDRIRHAIIDFKHIVRFEINYAHLGHNAVPEPTVESDALHMKILCPATLSVIVRIDSPLTVTTYYFGTIPTPLILDRMEDGQPKTQKDIIDLTNKLIDVVERLNNKISEF